MRRVGIGILIFIFVFVACYFSIEKFRIEENREEVLSESEEQERGEASKADSDAKENKTDGEGDTKESQQTQETVGDTADENTAKEKKLIALTFDDGPGSSSTDKILDVLEENNSRATFFVVGYNAEIHTEQLKREAELGCEIGNHSKSHGNLLKMTDNEIKEQVEGNNDLIREVTGKEVKLFRAPGGNYKGKEDVINMPLIQWTIDTNDWRKKDSANKSRTEQQRKEDIDAIVNYVLEEAGEGKIILMHDIYTFSADTVEALVPRLCKAGYTVTTVSDMFEYYGVTPENGKVYREAGADA